MSNVIALSGSDIHKIDGRLLNDFADGDAVLLEFESDLTTIKKGKNDNSLFALNVEGKKAKVTYRILRGSADDKWLNNRLAIMLNDFSAFVLMNAEATKNIGDGSGNLQSETYALIGGVFRRSPGSKDNVSGDTEVDVVVYELEFANAYRTIA